MFSGELFRVLKPGALLAFEVGEVTRQDSAGRNRPAMWCCGGPETGIGSDQ